MYECHLNIEKQPGESNIDYCKRYAETIDKESLIRCLLHQIKKMRPKRDRCDLWSYVGEATSHGSGISSAIVDLYAKDAE
jgi:hypothetical protein